MTENNGKRSNFRLIALAIFVGVLSAVGGISFWNVMQGPQQPSTATLMVLPEPRVIADFDLVDSEGQPFSLQNLRGRWTLMFFGFTNCPDVCPSALYDLNLVTEQLEELSGEESPATQVVFVSVDPERDTLEKLSEYLGYFNPEFIGVTGSQAQLAPLTMQLGIAYEIEEHEPGAEKYIVYHSVSFLLTDPEGRLYGVFPAPHDAEKMTSDLLAAIN
ncbi:MAG: SCO family protein [Xanthomonadales bacterium]|nr:SCO family protein [Xanthomonadales bacterium]